METTTSATSLSDREGNALGGLFQNIITDLKAGMNNWDDLLIKANKFHIQLKSTITSSTAFLDAFQKIADMATTTRGGTKEIGSELTRLCLRNRSVEAKLKSLTSSLSDSFIQPLQDRVDEWKKIIVQIDKEHNKEIKRVKQFRKKHYSHYSSSQETRVVSAHGFTNNTFKMKKPNKMKSDFPRIGSMYEVDKIIESSMMDNKEKYFMLEEVERNYVRRALIEEKNHYCLFFNLFRPVMEEEMSMLQEIIHLKEVVTKLASLTNDPYKLPSSSENFLSSLQLNDLTTGSVSLDLPYSSAQSEYDSPQTPINGTSSCHSRKSSISSMDSFNTLSTDSISFRNCKASSQPNVNPVGFRPKSIASQDSGFLSHDYNVPNINRLVIYNSKKNVQVPKTGEPICLLNGKPVLCSPKEIINRIHPNDNRVEYATSESLFASSLVAPPPPPPCPQSNQQPIYVNIQDSYSNSGSITPTNQEIRSPADLKPTDVASPIYIKPKRLPPKPPIRVTSKLSSQQNDSTETAKRNSTLIYVQPNNKENSIEFPPPPPEAYLTIRPTSEPRKSVTENLCCRYSVPSSHLVFCDNQECLKDLEPINATSINETHHYGSSSHQYLSPTQSNNGYITPKTYESDLTCIAADNETTKSWSRATPAQDCNPYMAFETRYHGPNDLSNEH